jgi:hypothetical protein
MIQKLISVEEAPVGKVQHTKACSDCPMRRDALNGWLGGSTPEEYGHLAHSDQVVGCHAIKGTQCAGIAIYRRNVCKSTQAPNIKLEADRETVFANRQEFLDHHNAGPGSGAIRSRLTKGQSMLTKGQSIPTLEIS